jgi:subtilase family serine protease
MFSTKSILMASVALALGFAAAAAPASAEVPKLLSAATSSEIVRFQFYFPPRDMAGLKSLVAAQNQKGSPQYHKWLTPAQFQDRFGPTADTINKVTSELTLHGLSVVEHQGLMLSVAGSASAVQDAFGVRLSHAQFADGFQSLVADRALTMTPALAASGALTPNFSTAAQMHKDSVIVGPAAPRNFKSATGPYLAADLRQAYDFPSAKSLTAKGVNIAILMDGDYNLTDIQDYFKDDGLPTSLWPTLTSIPINGGLAFSTSTSGETHLDIQQSGSVSMAANIGLYNLSDLSPATIIFGLNHIVSDNVADVVNMSFGGPEADLLPANNKGISQFYLLDMEDWVFYQGTSQGITFVASSGDHGAIPLVGASQKPTLSVDDPASDPNVLSVGGTNLVTSYTAGSTQSTYVSENANYDSEPNGEVWASGGGISIYWPQPSYQTLVPTPSTKFRTVPDVAQHMGGCPSGATKCPTPYSADYEVIGGASVTVIGTSASAPDITGLLALKVKLTKGRLGLENVDVYTQAKNQIAGTGTPFHHTGIPGNNGHYATKVPYDLVIGNGTVDGRQLLGATNLPAAGDPNTTTNP